MGIGNWVNGCIKERSGLNLKIINQKIRRLAFNKGFLE
jgi:hypothetical protein